MPPRPQQSETAASDAASPTTLKELQESLDRQERKTGPSGAVPLTPKQALLDASDLADAHPDRHYRWLNTGNAEVIRLRRQEGYERVPESEGGRQVGGLGLFVQSAERHRERTEAEARLHKERLSQHNREVESAAETVARHLRDKHGLNIKAEDILVKG